MTAGTKTRQSDFGIWEVGFYYSATTALLSANQGYVMVYMGGKKLKIGFEKRAVVFFQIWRRVHGV